MFHVTSYETMTPRSRSESTCSCDFPLKMYDDFKWRECFFDSKIFWLKCYCKVLNRFAMSLGLSARVLLDAWEIRSAVDAVCVAMETLFGIVRDFDFCLRIDRKRLGLLLTLDSRDAKYSSRRWRSERFILVRRLLNFSFR